MNQRRRNSGGRPCEPDMQLHRALDAGAPGPPLDANGRECPPRQLHRDIYASGSADLTTYDPSASTDIPRFTPTAQSAGAGDERFNVTVVSAEVAKGWRAVRVVIHESAAGCDGWDNAVEWKLYCAGAPIDTVPVWRGDVRELAFEIADKATPGGSIQLRAAIHKDYWTNGSGTIKLRSRMVAVARIVVRTMPNELC